VIGAHVGLLEPQGGLPRSMMVADAGPVRVFDLVVDRPGGAVRARRHIRSDDPELCVIDVVARGHGAVSQGKQRAGVRAGDFTVVDLARPARWEMSATRIIKVAFPWAMVQLADDDLGRVAAVPIRGGDGATGAAALASSLAIGLADQLALQPDGATATDPRLGSAVVDLFSAALHARLDKRLPQRTRDQAILHHVHQFIETHLSDPDLSPASVAAAHHISRRYLYKILAREDLTVGRLIQQLRLERCRNDLADPGKSSAPVSAIAARWGLTHAGHFSRLFRAAYGVTPTEYRAMFVPRQPASPRRDASS
jgi:AraC-like DNA-binding protein